MKVTLKENELVVNTEIKKADFDKQVTDMVVRDKDGNITFTLEVGAYPEISKLGLTCNGTIDGNLAVTMPLNFDDKENEVKIKYGKALVNAKAGLKVLSKNIARDTSLIAQIFG